MLQVRINYSKSFWIHRFPWHRDSEKSYMASLPESWEDLSKKQLKNLAKLYFATDFLAIQLRENKGTWFIPEYSQMIQHVQQLQTDKRFVVSDASQYPEVKEGAAVYHFDFKAWREESENNPMQIVPRSNFIFRVSDQAMLTAFMRIRILLRLPKKVFREFNNEDINLFTEHTLWAAKLEAFWQAKPLKKWTLFCRAPKPFFANLCIGDYAYADQLLEKLLQTPSTRLLRQHFAATHSFLGFPKNSVTNAITRCFAYLVGKSTRSLSVLSFIAQRNALAKKWPTQHKKTGKKGPKSQGWFTVLTNVAASGPYGSYYDVQKVKTHELIAHLEDCAEKYFHEVTQEEFKQLRAQK